MCGHRNPRSVLLFDACYARRIANKGCRAYASNSIAFERLPANAPRYSCISVWQQPVHIEFPGCACHSPMCRRFHACRCILSHSLRRHRKLHRIPRRVPSARSLRAIPQFRSKYCSHRRREESPAPPHSGHCHWCRTRPCRSPTAMPSVVGRRSGNRRRSPRKSKRRRRQMGGGRIEHARSGVKRKAFSGHGAATNIGAKEISSVVPEARRGERISAQLKLLHGVIRRR